MRQTLSSAGVAITLGAQEAEWLLLAAPGLIWGTSFLFIAEGMQTQLGPVGSPLFGF
jgi:hypothetical protein